MTEVTTAVALVSGGLDSLVAAGLAREAGHRLLMLSIDYNQRHYLEIAAARRIAHTLGAARHVVLPIDLSAFGGSALTDSIDVPKDGVAPGIPVTYVPARNTVFLSLCLAWAEAAGARSLRAYRGAIVRRHGQFADLGSSVRTDCVVTGYVTRFSTVEKRKWGRATLISKP